MTHSKPQKAPQPPPLFTATPTSILSDTKRLISHSLALQNHLTSSIQPATATFATVLLPLAQAENAMHLESNIICFYKDVSPDPKLREASNEAQKLLADFAIETAMRSDLYQLVDSVLKKNEELEPEERHLLEKEHEKYVRNGLNIPAGKERERYAEIQKKLSQLSLQFRETQNEENGGCWFSPDELEGLPVDVMEGLEKGERKNEGKLKLGFEMPQYIPALQYIRNRETRKVYFIASQRRCFRNVRTFREIMILRDEAARMLGYESHAEFKIEEKMAKTPSTANTFLTDLRERLTAGGRKELEELKQLQKRDVESRGEEYDGRLFWWDSTYYKQMMLEKQYAVEQQKIAEFFPLQTSVRGMLGTFEKLFGLNFVELVGDERTRLSGDKEGSGLVWHEDVQVFSVWDDEEEGGGFLGYLYLDLFPREGKYGGAANFSVVPGFLREDGTRQHPSTAMVCSFTKPTPNKPSLLKHDEIVLLFHELGHGIHDLVSKTTYARFHGPMGVVVDFGEGPSQMLENWCWKPSVLKSLSRHYSYLSPSYLSAWEEQEHANGRRTPKPPEQIPDEMIGSLIRAKHVNRSLLYLQMLFLSIFDMVIHEPASHEEIKDMNITVEYNKLRKSLLGIDGPEVLGRDEDWEWGFAQANLGHVISEYDAGLYGYLFSRVFADDIFRTVFEKDPMDRNEGRKYRHAVLEKGGSQDEMSTVEDFLGRAIKTEAFYEELGLA